MVLSGVALGALVAALSVAAAVRTPGPVAVAAVMPTSSAPAPSTEKPTPSSPTPTTVAVPTGASLAKLVPGQLSVLVHDRQTGKDLVSYRPGATYTSASVVKLLIAFQVLDQGGSPSAVQEMLSRSDDATASELWTAYGGPSIVTRWAEKIGMTSTKPPSTADPGHWGSTKIDATDLAKLYEYLMDKAPAGLRKTVLSALDNATQRGADGFDQYFGIPGAVTKTDWGVKQGWSCCDPGRNLHTTGLVDQRRYIVIVLSAQPSSTSWATASGRVTQVVQQLAAAFGW